MLISWRTPPLYGLLARRFVGPRRVQSDILADLLEELDELRAALVRQDAVDDRAAHLIVDLEV